jgi:mannose/fructose-specific phosphotransferase system component IIA
MIRIFIVSRLNLAAQFIEVAEKICGKQEHLIGVSLNMDEPQLVIAEKVSHVIDACCSRDGDGKCDGVLILTDLYGSTPTNTILEKTCKGCPAMEIITGVNVPMIVSAIVNRNRLELRPLAEKIEAAGKKGVMNAKRFSAATKESWM